MARPWRASKSSRDPYSAGYITCTILPHNMTDQVFAPYMPVVGHFEGSDLATTVWDLLAGQVEPGDEVLVFDEAGGHAGLSCAQFAAAKDSSWVPRSASSSRRTSAMISATRVSISSLASLAMRSP